MATVQMVASGEDLFQLLKDGTIKRFTGTRDDPFHWTQLDANVDVKEITVGDKLYKRHGNGKIFVYKHPNWYEIDRGRFEGFAKILAAVASKHQRHKTTSYILFTDDTEEVFWDRSAGDILQIAADQGSFYARTTDGHIYQLMDEYEPAILEYNSNTAEIVAGNGCLYQRHHDGQVYRYLKGFWDRLGGDKTTVQIAAGSAGLYRRDKNGQVWGYIEGDNMWKLIDKSHDNIDIVVAKWLYVMTENSSIYRYTGANWEQLQ